MDEVCCSLQIGNSKHLSLIQTDKVINCKDNIGHGKNHTKSCVFYCYRTHHIKKVTNQQNPFNMQHKQLDLSVTNGPTINLKLLCISS